MPHWTIKSANIVAAIITVIGCTQMAGYLTGSRELGAIGLATVAAPLPKVFSDVEGLETFASEFTLHGIDSAGNPFTLPITPERYAGLEGCYNRRNVYVAALSYAPRMPEALWAAVFCYGLKPGGPLRRELGLPHGARKLSVEIRTKTRGRTGTWMLNPECAQ